MIIVWLLDIYVAFKALLFFCISCTYSYIQTTLFRNCKYTRYTNSTQSFSLWLWSCEMWSDWVTDETVVISRRLFKRKQIFPFNVSAETERAALVWIGCQGGLTDLSTLFSMHQTITNVVGLKCSCLRLSLEVNSHTRTSNRKDSKTKLGDPSTCSSWL